MSGNQLARLYLARHGSTGRYFHSRYTPLNDEGRKQTQALGKKLINEDITVIISGNIVRLKQSARILEKTLGLKKKRINTKYESDLSPYMVGNWEAVPIRIDYNLDYNLSMLDELFNRTRKEFKDNEQLSKKQAKLKGQGLLPEDEPDWAEESNLHKQTFTDYIADQIVDNLRLLLFPSHHIVSTYKDIIARFGNDPIHLEEETIDLRSRNILIVGSGRTLQVIRYIFQYGIPKNIDEFPTFGDLYQAMPIPYSGCWEMSVNRNMRVEGQIRQIAPEGVIFKPEGQLPNREGHIYRPKEG